MISGLQVDAWGAFIPNRAALVDQIKASLVQEVQSRGIEDLEVTTQNLGVGTTWQALTGEKREHIVFEQKLGVGAAAAMAVRVAPRGTQDLEISWRLFEGNVAKGILEGVSQTTLIVVGVLWTLLSIALMPLGVGFCTVIIGPVIMGFGFGWWGAKRGKTKATSYQQLDSRALAQAVDFSLMTCLEKLGVTAEELRVLKAAQMEGIGKLVPS
jgi:hypothetical protein